jgi:hypothetical protein
MLWLVGKGFLEQTLSWIGQMTWSCITVMNNLTNFHFLPLPLLKKVVSKLKNRFLGTFTKSAVVSKLKNRFLGTFTKSAVVTN